MKITSENLICAFAAVAMATAGCSTRCRCGCDECARDPLDVCTAEETAEGFKPLFTGVDFENWVVSTNGSYVIEPGGVLAYNHLKSGGMWTKKSYRDFDLRFEFKLSYGCNNGLGVRVPEGTYDTYNGGFELQILDDDCLSYSTTLAQLGLKLHDYQRHGSVYGVVPSKRRPDGRGYLKPCGQWNSQRVEMRGSRLRVWLNGEKIQDCDLADCSVDGLDHAKHNGIRSREGRFGWLSHGYPCHWRRIRIKEL